VTSNNCNVRVTSALSASPVRKSLRSHLKHLSQSRVGTITKPALQICQNILTAALDVWLKLYTSTSFTFRKLHGIWKGTQRAQVHKEQSGMLTKINLPGTHGAQNTQPIFQMYTWSLSLLQLLLKYNIQERKLL